MRKLGQWWDVSRSPVIGCSKVSRGCDNCWAERMAWRHAHNPATRELYEQVVTDGRWDGRAAFNRKALAPVPGKGKIVAVNFMGDLFCDQVPNSWIFETMRWVQLHQQHQFVCCTKRPDRIYETEKLYPENLLFMASVEDEQSTDDRLLVGQRLPFGLHIEPLLGPVETESFVGYLPWVVVGAETGPGARPCDPDWIRKIRDDCLDASVPFFLKQIDAKRNRELDGQTWDQTPWG